MDHLDLLFKVTGIILEKVCELDKPMSNKQSKLVKGRLSGDISDEFVYGSQPSH